MAKDAKNIATISLATMGAGFAITLGLPDTTAVRILQTGFEAGLVGGLADWFAVTALFRHPAGIRIPHTALLIKNRERITRAVVSSVENDLLNKDSIALKIRGFSLVEKIVELLRQELAKPSVQNGIAAAAEQLLLRIDPRKWTPLLEKESRRLINSVDLSVIMSAIVMEIRKQGYEEKMLDYAIDRIAEWTASSEGARKLGVFAMVAVEKLEFNGFAGFAVNMMKGMLTEDKLGGILQNVIMGSLRDLRLLSDHNRALILAALRTELDRLASNSQLITRLDELKEDWLTQFKPGEKLAEWLLEGRERLLERLREEGFVLERVMPVMLQQLDEFANSEQSKHLDGWLKGQLIQVVADNHTRIGQLVKENLDKLDNNTVIGMLERSIGQDIQWIRVNGALCGFMIGLVLAGIKWVF